MGVVKETGVLNDETIRAAIESLRENARTPGNFLWIDNEHFYRGKIAEAWGWKCAENEIARAKVSESGFIKTVGDVDLYLTRYLPTWSK